MGPNRAIPHPALPDDDEEHPEDEGLGCMSDVI
jgi:hypothetical protein